MSREEHYLRMFLVRETASAVNVTDKPALQHGEARRIEWLPRSQIGYARKEPAAAPGEAQPYVFTLPEWLIEKANLWNFVTDQR